MKNLIPIFALMLLVQTAQAQDIWFDVALRGGVGISILNNSNIWNDNSNNHQLSSSNGFGGRVGINVGYQHGLLVGFTSRNMKQKFEYRVAPGVDPILKNDLTWRNADLTMVYRGGGAAAYAEIGAMISFVQSVKQDDELLPADFDANPYYRKKYTSAVLGFGSYLVGNEVVSLNMGFRIHYSLQDFISEEGMNPESPYSSFPSPGLLVNYPDYKKSQPLYVEFGIEMAFGIGRIAKASCSDRRHFIWSGNN